MMVVVMFLYVFLITPFCFPNDVSSVGSIDPDGFHSVFCGVIQLMRIS